MLERKSETELGILSAIADNIEDGKKLTGFDKDRIASQALRSYVDLCKRVNKVVEYLALPKFDRPDNWVNVDDIFLRLNEDID